MAIHDETIFPAHNGQTPSSTDSLTESWTGSSAKGESSDTALDPSSDLSQDSSSNPSSDPSPDLDTLAQGNPFDILAIPLVFHVDKATLNHHYERMQQCCHPDMWIHESAKQQGQALSAKLTWAWTLLTHPITRARILLQCRGKPFWPLDTFPDLMASFFQLQENHDPIHHQPVWQARWHQAVQDFCTALDDVNPQAAQRAYWWMLHVHKYVHWD